MRCKTCHYSLENLHEDRCPECGREFDPNDPSTFMTEAAFEARRNSRRVWFVSHGIGVMMFVLTLFALIATGYVDRDAGVLVALIPASIVVLLAWWIAKRT